MAEVEQPTRRHGAGLDVVKGDEVVRRPGDETPHKHGRNIDFGHQPPTVPGVRVRGNENEAGDALRAHHAQDPHLEVGVFVRVVNKRHVSGMKAVLFDDPRERGKMRIGDVGNDDADQSRTSAAQRLRRLLRSVADFGDRPLDPRHDLGARRRRSVDDRRHGRDRNAGFLGDISDGGHGGTFLDSSALSVYRRNVSTARKIRALPAGATGVVKRGHREDYRERTTDWAYLGGGFVPRRGRGVG